MVSILLIGPRVGGGATLQAAGTVQIVRASEKMVLCVGHLLATAGFFAYITDPGLAEAAAAADAIGSWSCYAGYEWIRTTA